MEKVVVWEGTGGLRFDGSEGFFCFFPKGFESGLVGVVGSFAFAVELCFDVVEALGKALASFMESVFAIEMKLSTELGDRKQQVTDLGSASFWVVGLHGFF